MKWKIFELFISWIRSWNIKKSNIKENLYKYKKFGYYQTSLNFSLTA